MRQLLRQLLIGLVLTHLLLVSVAGNYCCIASVSQRIECGERERQKE